LSERSKGDSAIAVIIDKTAIVEDGARLADGVEIGPFSIIGPHVTIGEGTKILGGATVTGHTTIGVENIIHPYSVIGGLPQDLKYLGGDTRLEIGDRNVIREHVTMNVGTETGGGVTRVGSDNLLMCACHVAHDCKVGSRCVISNQVLMAGHIIVGDSVVLSGGVALHHFVTVGEYAFIGGLSRVVRDVPPFMISEGDPTRCRGVNVVGLRRNGFTDEALEALQNAYRKVFRSASAMSEALDELAAGSPCREVERLIEFLRARTAGKHGRSLQP
jgi:UDP-N-acetylglucosamine acyltransferase